jgi:hypothetical protein
MVTVDVGRADWKSLPSLKTAGRPLPTPLMVEKVENLLASGKCKLKGQSANRFDITIPYAVLVKPDGSSNNVIVGETGCAELESLVGVVVLQLAREGEFRPSAGDKQPRWLASAINFNLE